MPNHLWRLWLKPLELLPHPLAPSPCGRRLRAAPRRGLPDVNLGFELSACRGLGHLRRTLKRLRNLAPLPPTAAMARGQPPRRAAALLVAVASLARLAAALRPAAEALRLEVGDVASQDSAAGGAGRTPGISPPGVAGDDMLPAWEWRRKYDFVVRIKTDGNSMCTGISFKGNVLSAAHCSVNATRWGYTVFTLYEQSRATWLGNHPLWNPTSLRPVDYDFMLLKLDLEFLNVAPFFMSTLSPAASHLRIVGMGESTSTRVPERPIRSPELPTVPCPLYSDWAICAAVSTRSNCAGDSGGPWLTVVDDTPVIGGMSLFGIDSRDFNISTPACGSPVYGGFTAIFKAKTWLETAFYPAKVFPWRNIPMP